MNKFIKLIFIVSIIFLSTCRTHETKQVLLLGIDGLSTDGIQIAKTPYLNRLIRDGAFTLKARGVMPTVSAPNWGSMLCGAGPEQHGMTKNGWTTNNYTVEATTTDDDGYFPSIFTIIREQMPEAKTAIFYDWNALIDLFNPKYIDSIHFAKDYEEVYEKAIPYVIESKPEFAFIYAGHVDHIGHTYQHGSPEYYKSIEDVDAKIGELLNALDKAGLYEETHIIVISDHGGVGYGHGGESMAEIQVPWLIKGPGIIKNRLIAEPVNTYNTASTIAYLFGLQQHEHWIGKPVLGAFSNNDNSKLNHNVYLPKPKASLKSGIYTESKQLSLSVNAEDAEIRFTLDGTDPDETSTLYSHSLNLEQTQIVKAITVKDKIKSKISIIEFTKVLGIKSVDLKNMPSSKFPAEYGGLSLVDGKLGNDDFNHSAWMGFEVNDFEAVFDFGKVQSFNKVSLRCIENQGSWIFLPTQVEILVSKNGKIFKSIGILNEDEIKSPEKRNTILIEKKFTNVNSRYLKVIAKNIGQCPKGHAGEGARLGYLWMK